ncbi:MAG: FtsX-like permease family protein [Phycisphaerae bacterium]|nr:FtsX-like permease family protein [Phycisphaerae bacterium]
MRGPTLLVVRRLLHELPQTAILVACLAVAFLLPIGGRLLLDRWSTELRARANATPLVVGRAGSPIELVLAALHFQRRDLPPIEFGEVLALDGRPELVAVPLSLGFTARGRPIVGTRLDYFERRGLRPAAGSLPLRLGDCVLGATVARELDLAPGDSLFSDPREAYDLATAPPLRMLVRGVLAPSGTSDDDAVFADLRTAWILGGLLHGHADPVRLPEAAILGRDGERIVVDEGIREYFEVTDGNLAGFHLHGEESSMPVSAILVFPQDARTSVIEEGRLDAPATRQAVRPAEVIDELLATVARVKRLFDAVTAVLVATTVLLASLVIALSLRARRGEILVMQAIGASPWTIRRVLAGEIAVVAIAAIVAGALAAWAISHTAPDLLRLMVG